MNGMIREYKIRKDKSLMLKKQIIDFISSGEKLQKGVGDKWIATEGGRRKVISILNNKNNCWILPSLPEQNGKIKALYDVFNKSYFEKEEKPEILGSLHSFKEEERLKRKKIGRIEKFQYGKLEKRLEIRNLLMLANIWNCYFMNMNYCTKLKKTRMKIMKN
jgi:hypothetical protein